MEAEIAFGERLSLADMLRMTRHAHRARGFLARCAINKTPVAWCISGFCVQLGEYLWKDSAFGCNA